MNEDDSHQGENPVLDCQIVVSRLSRDGSALRYEADERERGALAAFMDIVSVQALVADVAVSPWRRDGVSVRGRLHCELTQASVVTLEPVPQTIDEPVDLTFLPEGSRSNRPRRSDDGELVLDPEGADVPETFSGDRIDLGAAFMEMVALALDPYPRGVDENEGARDAADGNGDADERVSPFAALARFGREGA